MASGITLSAGVRQNLLSLQNTANLMATTQNRLATGKKVNSALDNPSNFFTASSLQSRGNDLSSLLDSMSNGIKTLEAADNGLSSITKTVETMQSTLRQARQDKSFQTQSYSIATDSTGAITTTGSLTFSGGAVGTGPITINLTEAGSGGSSAVVAAATGTGGFAGGAGNDAVGAGNGGTLTINGRAMTINATDKVADVINTINANTGTTGVTAGVSGGQLTLTGNAQGANIQVDGTAALLGGIGLGAAGTGTATSRTIAGTAAVPASGSRNTLDQLVAAINSQAGGSVTASNDNGKLRIQNNSTADLTVGGTSSGAITGNASTTSVGGNETRKSLVKQFNELRDQLNKTADDASYNGVNLLRKDQLKLTFNETGTSTMDIQVKDTSGQAMSIDADTLKINSAVNSDFDSDTKIDSSLAGLGDALNTLRSQSSSLGSKLSIVQNRQDFTKSMINTLQTGADGLVLADTNEEGANLLALQTRQQLSTTALSMASQASQAVLRLF